MARAHDAAGQPTPSAQRERNGNQATNGDGDAYRRREDDAFSRLPWRRQSALATHCISHPALFLILFMLPARPSQPAASSQQPASNQPHPAPLPASRAAVPPLDPDFEDEPRLQPFGARRRQRRRRGDLFVCVDFGIFAVACLGLSVVVIVVPVPQAALLARQDGKRCPLTCCPLWPALRERTPAPTYCGPILHVACPFVETTSSQRECVL
jgi:hypothetical protein